MLKKSIFSDVFDIILTLMMPEMCIPNDFMHNYTPNA